MNFSVLLSIYYREDVNNLRQALNSLLNQSLQPSEIIIIKDGPLTEDLNNILSSYMKKYSIIKCISLPQNVGLGRALNEGLKYCINEIVARMDTDDIAKPERFQKQIQYLKLHPDIDVVGSWTDEFIDNTDNIVSQRRLPELHHEILQFAKQRNPINHPTVMFRKKSVLEAGGYKHFPLFEDYFLWIRMLMNGAKFYNIQESLLFFRTSLDVYKRRGGFDYAITEMKLRKEMFSIGFISLWNYIIYALPRFIIRVIPSVFRKYLYKTFLR